MVLCRATIGITKRLRIRESLYSRKVVSLIQMTIVYCFGRETGLRLRRRRKHILNRYKLVSPPTTSRGRLADKITRAKPLLVIGYYSAGWRHLFLMEASRLREVLAFLDIVSLTTR